MEYDLIVYRSLSNPTTSSSLSNRFSDFLNYFYKFICIFIKKSKKFPVNLLIIVSLLSRVLVCDRNF